MMFGGGVTGEIGFFIPHNDRMVMMFGGGVTGEIGFSYEQRQEYRKKYITD